MAWPDKPTVRSNIGVAPETAAWYRARMFCKPPRKATIITSITGRLYLGSAALLAVIHMERFSPVFIMQLHEISSNDTYKDGIRYL